VNFFAIIVAGIGFTPSQTLLLTMGNTTLGIATMFFMWAGDRSKCRTLVGGIGPLLGIAGGAMLWALPKEQKIARLVGFFLCIWQSIATYIALSMVTTNIAGRTKKSVMSGVYLVCSCAGNLIGPHTFRQKDAPTYAPALITMVVLTSLNIGLLVVLYLYYRRENTKRDRLHGAPDAIQKEWVDLTDRENPSFRYVY
jgi:ACS family allantoate permease-like MFS transporter